MHRPGIVTITAPLQTPQPAPFADQKTVMNKEQKAFIRSLHKAMDMAYAANAGVNRAKNIGKPLDEKAVEEYLEQLRMFINASNRMILSVHLAFGENADMIGFRACANYLGDN
jgi:hypothetical protein